MPRSSEIQSLFHKSVINFIFLGVWLEVISENQSAFIPGMAISDNVLITHEVLHYLKTSEAHKNRSMAVKTDISKAYDRLKWNFLERVIFQMGFHIKFVK